MAIVKTLDILLRGRTEKLKTDMDKGKAIVSDFAIDLKGVLQNAFTGISTAVIVGKFRSVINALDDLGDRAKVFGASSEELGALEIAADLAAVKFEQLATASKFLLLNIAKANSGVKQSVDTFNALGVSATQLEKLSLTQRFEAIAMGLGKIDSQSKKAEIALKLFGKQGLLLLPLLANNGKELSSVLRDLQRFGILFTTEDTERLGAVNDAFSILGRTFDAVFGRIAVQASGILIQMARSLTEAIKPGTFLNGVMRGLADGLTVVLIGINLVSVAVRGLSELFGSWTGRVIGLVVSIFALARLSAFLVTVYTALRKVAAGLLAIETARAAIGGLTKYQIITALGAFGLVSGAIISFEGDIAKAYASVQQEQQKVIDGFGEIKNSAPTRINVGSAALGSQDALQTIFGVTLEGPMEKLVDLGNRQLEVQNQIRDGINGVDAAFDLDEQGTF